MAAIEAHGPVDTLLADGGPTANRTLMQLQADTERARRRALARPRSCRRSASRTSPGASRGSGRRTQLEALDRPRELYEPARGAGLAPRPRRRLARRRGPRPSPGGDRTCLALRAQTVVVTGAGGGIGKGIAARFAAEGARVVLADRSEAVHDGRRGARRHRRSGRHHRPRRCHRASSTPPSASTCWSTTPGSSRSPARGAHARRLGPRPARQHDRASSCAARPPRRGCARRAAAGGSSTPPPGRRARASSSPPLRRQQVRRRRAHADPSPRSWRRTRSPSTRTAPGSSAATCGPTTTANGAGCWAITSPAS